jgi:hypothetical protein
MTMSMSVARPATSSWSSSNNNDDHAHHDANEEEAATVASQEPRAHRHGKPALEQHRHLRLEKSHHVHDGGVFFAGAGLLPMFQELCIKTMVMSGLNFGVITLIPKLVGARDMCQFRPTTIINVIQRIISKFCVSRLAPFMER